MIKGKKLWISVLSLMMFLSSPNFIYGIAESSDSGKKQQFPLPEPEVIQKREEVLREINEVDGFIKEFSASHPSEEFRVERAAVVLGAMVESVQQADTLTKLQLMKDYIAFYVAEYKLGFITYNLKEKIAELESKKADLTDGRQQELEREIAEARKILEVLKPMHEVLKGKGTEMFNKAHAGDVDGFEALKADFDGPKAEVQKYENFSAQLNRKYTDLKNQEDKLKLVEKYGAMVIEKANAYKAKVDAAKKFLVKEERDEKKKEIDGARRNALLEFDRVVVGTKDTMETTMQEVMAEFEASAQATSDITKYGQVKRKLQEYIDTEAADKIKDATDRKNVQNELLEKVDKLDSQDKVDELIEKINKRIANPKSGSWASKNEDIINNQAVKDATSGLASGLHDGFKPQDTKVNPQAPSVAPAKINQVKKQHRIHKVSVPNTGV